MTAVGPRLSRDFHWLWRGSTASYLADRLTGFAVPSMAILVLNASNAEVGVLAALGWLAYPTLGIVAGALLAHTRRQPVMIAGELVRFAAFGSVPVAAALGMLTIVQLFVVVAIAGVATVFVDIASQCYTPSLVPPDLLFGANSRLQGSDSLSKLTGPALAGLIATVLGAIPGLALDSLPFLVSATARARVRYVEVVPEFGPDSGSIPTRIRSGLGTVRRNPLVCRVVCGSALRNFGMAIVDATLLLFAYRALHLSEAEGGLLLAAGAVGGLAGALASTAVVGRLKIRRTLLCTGLEGATWIAAPICLFVSPLALLVVIRMFTSMWLPIWNATTTSLRQATTPPEQQSEVQSTARTLMTSTVPVGSLVAGLASTALPAMLGTEAGLAVVLAAGGICASMSAVIMRPVTRGLSWRRLSDSARQVLADQPTPRQTPPT
jgi:hypothetical protein